jgi:hypothetical protein
MTSWTSSSAAILVGYVCVFYVMRVALSSGADADACGGGRDRSPAPAPLPFDVPLDCCTQCAARASSVDDANVDDAVAFMSRFDERTHCASHLDAMTRDSEHEVVSGVRLDVIRRCLLRPDRIRHVQQSTYEYVDEYVRRVASYLETRDLQRHLDALYHQNQHEYTYE